MNKVLTTIYTSGKDFFSKGKERSIKAKKNILISAFVKAGSILISLMMVPMTINYVNPTSYGIWITLSSIIGWFSFFDIGFGHGLRNRLAESIAKEDYDLAKKYVSTTYAIITLIVSVMLIMFLVINPFLDWSALLNAPQHMSQELSRTASIVFIYFCFQFILKLINTVFTANQDPSIASLFDFLANLLALVVIYLLTITTEGNLVYLGNAISISPVLVLIIGSFFLYKGKYKKFSPSLPFVEFKLTKDLVNLGLKFFIIQISSIVVYSTNNIIISHLFGPEEVTPYNISFKLFSIVTMGFTIISTPFWSAFTEAYVKNDLVWIKNVLKNLLRFWYLSIVVCSLIIFLSPFIIELWIGDQVKVSTALSLSIAIYVLTFIWHNIFATFLNGVSKIKLQFLSSIVISIVNIPLAILLGNLFGLKGIPMSGIIIFISMGIIYYIQTQKILNRTAKGIWFE